MEKIKQFLKDNQRSVAIAVGYILVAGIAFELGVSNAPTSFKTKATSQSAQTNYTPTVAAVQTAALASNVDCQGKIKGSTSLVYHLPGGAFYDRTTHPIRCFDTEAQAIAAGFRKSSR